MAQQTTTDAAATGSAPAIRAAWPIVGHTEAVAGLRRSLEYDRVSHAYLFAGPAGVGKMALATTFAQALCCPTATAAVPCRVCLACRKIARGVHPDVQTFGLEMQAALSDKSGGRGTVLTIDTVRLLCSSSALRPLEGRRRVIVVDDAERMQEVAQEALLKTLEEPPPSVVLILLADDAEVLLPTIRSRCRVVDLRPVERHAVVAALLSTGADPTRADEIAALARGRVGWAIRAAADPKVLVAHRAVVDQALRWIEGTVYDRLVTAVRLGDTFQRRRNDVFAELESLLAVWRDVLLVRCDLPDRAVHRSDLDRLVRLSRGWDLAALTRSVRAVQTCIADLEANVRPRLALETMVLQWPMLSRPS